MCIARTPLAGLSLRLFRGFGELLVKQGYQSKLETSAVFNNAANLKTELE